MPFRTFNSWIFDGRQDTPVPKATEKVDILKYNSPITHTFVISMFLKNGPLNHYLNKYFNNINLRYLSKEDLFVFIKRCVQDFKINKSQITFYPRRPRIILYEKLREKVPLLKNDDISLLCDIVEKSANRDAIYDSLGLDKPQKKKIKKEKKLKAKKISLTDFLSDHFSTIDV